MRRNCLILLAIVAIPTAALATPMPNASATPGVGSDRWSQCTAADRALLRAPNVWRVSWHECYPI